MSDDNKQYGLKEHDSYDIEELHARIEKRNKEKADRKKKARNKAIIILVGFVVLVGAIIFSLSNFFVVDYIEVRGNTHFADEEIINIAHATPGKNLIYHTGRAEIKDYLEANPYIRKASVHRKLPSTLVIKVEERTELCALKYDDDYLVIDNSGMLLKKTGTKPLLTLIKGLVVSKIELGQSVEVENEELREQTLDILNAMSKNDLYFVTLDMSEMYIKAYVYNGLVCKGTYSQLMEAMNKGRLHTVLEKLFEDGIQRGTITFSDEGYASFEPSIE
ncbi:MAG: FtsQ-type POTRA domain-containing protein [Clostridiales bacterium]|nr:FtsQ-type POTRA domain-containing protein [Candidatus Crickella caballi]